MAWLMWRREETKKGETKRERDEESRVWMETTKFSELHSSFLLFERPVTVAASLPPHDLDCPPPCPALDDDERNAQGLRPCAAPRWKQDWPQSQYVPSAPPVLHVLTCLRALQSRQMQRRTTSFAASLVSKVRTPRLDETTS